MECCYVECPRCRHSGESADNNTGRDQGYGASSKEGETSRVDMLLDWLDQARRFETDLPHNGAKALYHFIHARGSNDG